MDGDGLNFGAGEGNRTLVVSLGSFCSAIELHPRESAVIAMGQDEASRRLVRRTSVLEVENDDRLSEMALTGFEGGELDALLEARAPAGGRKSSRSMRPLLSSRGQAISGCLAATD